MPTDRERDLERARDLVRTHGLRGHSNDDGSSMEEAIADALAEARLDGMRIALSRVEALGAEFGDDPDACVRIIGEYVGVALHHMNRAASEALKGEGDGE